MKTDVDNDGLDISDEELDHIENNFFLDATNSVKPRIPEDLDHIFKDVPYSG